MKNKLVAMENAFFDAAPQYRWEQRCAAIAEAGFDGVYVVPWPLTDECFKGYLRDITSAPAAHGLTVSTFFANIDFAVPSSSARTRRVLEEVHGFTRLELSLKCSDPAQTPSAPIQAACKELELLLPLAEARNTEICLYHHTFYPIYHPDQCAEIIKLLDHPLLSHAFATSHAYAHFTDEEILQILTRHAPHIKSFNFCGCKRPGPFGSTKTKQYPLYESDLPLEPLLKILADSSYSGDIVVQGHGWQGDITENLRRSKAWYSNFQAARKFLAAPAHRTRPGRASELGSEGDDRAAATRRKTLTMECVRDRTAPYFLNIGSSEFPRDMR